MDDIDDLLDEVESKYVKKAAKPCAPSSTNRSQNATATAAKPKSRIDEAISDILDLELEDSSVDQTDHKSCKSPALPPPRGAAGDTPKRACLPAHLSGSSVSLGRGSSVSKLACDQLRCTSCDFRICCFDNMAWSKDTDYLFLRNNVPDFQKLKSKLSRRKGSRAYCCQCTWRNIQELVEISDPSLKWVCGKHVS